MQDTASPLHGWLGATTVDTVEARTFSAGPDAKSGGGTGRYFDFFSDPVIPTNCCPSRTRENFRVIVSPETVRS